MSAEAITDAAVRHFAENVSGIKAAYAGGAGGQGTNVKTYPKSLTDGPVAILELGSLRYDMDPGSFERTRWRFTVNIWLLAQDQANAGFAAVPFFTRVRDSLRANVGLYGTCAWAIASTAGPPAPEQVDGSPWLVLPFDIVALELVPGATYLPGPSS